MHNFVIQCYEGAKRKKCLINPWSFVIMAKAEDKVLNILRVS
jgi:hypothetical protein